MKQTQEIPYIDSIFRKVYGGFLLRRVGVIKEKLKALKIQIGSADNFIQINPDIAVEGKI